MAAGVAAGVPRTTWLAPASSRLSALIAADAYSHPSYGTNIVLLETIINDIWTGGMANPGTPQTGGCLTFNHGLRSRIHSYI